MKKRFGLNVADNYALAVTKNLDFEFNFRLCFANHFLITKPSLIGGFSSSNHFKGFRWTLFS
jgi:hypothetical protein